MTDQELLESADLKRLLDRLCRRKRRRPSDRDFRLFATGFWRWQFTNLKAESAEEFLRAAALAEEWAEAGVRPAGMNAYRGNVLAEKHASTAAKRTAALLQQSDTSTRVRERVLPLFRCVFGNLLGLVAPDLGWMNPTIAGIAKATYEERKLPSGELDDTHLAILADALEDAGCDNQDILSHLRSPGPHTRGCWPVDLVLGRS